MEDIHGSLKKNGVHIFSVPNIKFMIRNGYANAMNFEHPYFLEEAMIDYLLKKNQDRGYPDLSLFEIGPTFSGNKPGEQQIVIGGLKSGVANRKSWDSKARNIDVFDVKADLSLIHI